MKPLRRAGRFAARLLAGLIALPLAYLLVALILGLIPSNRHWHPAADGVVIWVTTNGVHAGIAMPARTDTIDWPAVFPRTDMRDGRGDVVTVGWGDRKFFLETPTWADLSASTAVNALLGLDGTVMHVEYGAVPAQGPSATKIVLTRDAYRQLVDHVLASVPRDGSGMARAIPGHHYTDDDAFYEAHGRYSLFVTCNQWTRSTLHAAGVRVPVWSPFDKAIFWQLRNAPSAQTVEK